MECTEAREGTRGVPHAPRGCGVVGTLHALARPPSSAPGGSQSLCPLSLWLRLSDLNLRGSVEAHVPMGPGCPSDPGPRSAGGYGGGPCLLLSASLRRQPARCQVSTGPSRHLVLAAPGVVEGARRGSRWPWPPGSPPAPAPSAANVKKWEIELQTLRESNARLSTALQESAASAEQWKRQFSVCRDENDQLRSKVGGGGGHPSREEQGMGLTDSWPGGSRAPAAPLQTRRGKRGPSLLPLPKSAH